MANRKEIIAQTAKNTYGRCKKSTLKTVSADLKRLEKNKPVDRKSYMYLLYLGVKRGLLKRMSELKRKS
jgi:hypothetical protein